jgi:hypothetical protein
MRAWDDICQAFVMPNSLPSFGLIWLDNVLPKAIGSAIDNYAGSVEDIVKYGSLPSIVSALALWLV